MLNFKVDVRGLEEVKRSLNRLSTDLRDKASAMAINKTAAKANTELARAITAEFNIKQAEVKNAVSISKASAKRGGEVEATISVFGSRSKRGRSLNVSHFLEKSITMAEAKRRAKRGELVTIGKGGRMYPILGFKFKKGSGVKHIKGAFIGNKGRTVFIRTGDKRLPIKPVQMIGVSQMFTTKTVNKRVMDRIDKELVIEMDRAVSLLVERHMR